VSPIPRRRYAVRLYGERIGSLDQRGDHVGFSFDRAYVGQKARPVLGLRFEDSLTQPYASALRLPRWFSNLLPEGPLRRWIAEHRGVSADREMELLAQVGHDLPGAVEVVATDEEELAWPPDHTDASRYPAHPPPPVETPWRFSLAGVALKFSMLAEHDRLVVPAAGRRGDWIVKFPDRQFPDVPRNEYAMMSFARSVGITVPEVRLVHRDELVDLPARMWPGTEEWAYAIRRFDRADDLARTPVHIEDLAQVRDIYPESKYQGSFESIAVVVYRERNPKTLQEFARRLAFSVLIGNGDAHLKNWSLIYLDRRKPTLSPAYDIVSTVIYSVGGGADDLGLRFCGSRRFEDVTISCFSRMEAAIDRRFGTTNADLAAVVDETVRRAAREWPAYRDLLAATSPALSTSIDGWLTRRIAGLAAPR
jgi:serine/threonine-protein kinase HipA